MRLSRQCGGGLVEPELRSQWFAGGAFELREGGAADLVFDHDNLSVGRRALPAQYAAHKSATSHERIVKVEPPRLLAFTWDGGKEGVANFELSDAGSGRTRLVLTHSGITGPAPMANFRCRLETRILPCCRRSSQARTSRNFWALHEESEKEIAGRWPKLPRRARTESGSSLRAERSNPVERQDQLDCFVASLPRNDKALIRGQAVTKFVLIRLSLLLAIPGLLARPGPHQRSGGTLSGHVGNSRSGPVWPSRFVVFPPMA
jgi:hypothetical protein